VKDEVEKCWRKRREISPFVSMFQSVRSYCACDVNSLLMQAETNDKAQARENERLGRAIVRTFGLSRY
jgi:hypothetical protein